MANDELGQVVQGFRAAEESLTELVNQADRLQTAAGALATAKTGVDEAAGELRGAAEAITDTGAKLGVLSAELRTATEALIAADPEGVKRELERNVDQVERLRSRVDEAAGESRSNVERLQNRVDEASKDAQASTESLQSSVAQLRILAVLTLIVAIAAVVVPFIAP